MPGAQVGCACLGGGTGVQTCTPDGSGLDACRCLPSPNSYAAPEAPRRVAARPVLAPAGVVRPKRTIWYGWQTLTADGLASGLAVAALVSDSSPLALTSGIVSILGAPAVHMAHGNYGTAALSVGLRALPVAVLAYALPINDPDDARSALIAVGVYQALMIATDAALLARETIEAPPPAAAVRVTGGGAFALRGGAGLSLSGSF